jgi:glycosyltransferase involved in cell wall biosynthesis
MPKNIIVNKSKIKKADIVVGIPSLNEADNISFVVKQVDKGLKKYFKDYKCVIVNVDNDSPDNTKKHFLDTKTVNPKIYISTPPGVRGKGNNFYNLFKEVIKLKAKAICVVDADLRSINPEWVYSFIKPILEGQDYITPNYARCEYDGSLTNHICYPLIYGLFGKKIRQPIGGDFSFSPKLANYWLKQKWHKTTYLYGIDIFMTMHALMGSFKIEQTNLGAKVHKPSAPKLGPMFTQVLTTFFKFIKAHKRKWLNPKVKNDMINFGKGRLEECQTLSVDYKGMKEASIFDFVANEDTLKRALSPNVYRKLKKMYNKKIVDINAKLWNKILYDFVYTYNNSYSHTDLIEAMKSLYFGRFTTFFKTTLEKPSFECESEIKRQAQIFWKNRDYLLNKFKK